MKNKVVEGKTENTDNQRVTNHSHLKSSMVKNTEIDPVYAELAGEGHEDFYNYLDWLGLAKSPGFLILASTHHYYFETEDLKSVRTLVSLKKLNTLTKPKDFMKDIHSMLPHKCHFIGCFTDNKKQSVFSATKKNPPPVDSLDASSEITTGRWNSFLNVLYGVIDAKTNRYMSEKSVRLMLEEAGFKILDITEFNGLTYFCTQKENPSAE